MNQLSDAQLLQKRVLPLLAEAGAVAGKCDAGHPDLAAKIRSRCAHLDNASRAAYSRPLSAEERKMIDTHLRKLRALIRDATTLLKG